MRAKSAAKATKPRPPEAPTGTVAFLFTDIEGSTRLARSLPDDYESLLERHRSILRQAFTRHAGFEVGTEGDSFFVAFGSPLQALRAAAEGQRALTAAEWPPGADLRVRMGLHLGEATRTEDDYVGLEIHRAARIAAAGHGGQVLVSQAMAAVLGDRLPEELALRELGATSPLWPELSNHPLDLTRHCPGTRAGGLQLPRRPRSTKPGRTTIKDRVVRGSGTVAHADCGNLFDKAPNTDLATRVAMCERYGTRSALAFPADCAPGGIR